MPPCALRNLHSPFQTCQSSLFVMQASFGSAQPCDCSAALRTCILALFTCQTEQHSLHTLAACSDTFPSSRAVHEHTNDIGRLGHFSRTRAGWHEDETRGDAQAIRLFLTRPCFRSGHYRTWIGLSADKGEQIASIA